MALAIFDLDETILDIDSDYAWTKFIYKKNIETNLDFYEKMKEFKQDYINGTLDIYKYIEYCVKPITRLPSSQIKKLQEEYYEKEIKSFIRKKAVDLIKKHQEKNDFFLIITATNSIVTSIIAQNLGADDLIATEIEKQGDFYIPKIKGIPSFQKGKVTRLKSWLEKRPEFGLKGSYFYSDSFNDLPLLQLVDHPVAVNPDKKLHHYAHEKNWLELDLKN